jgi:hypothetical protein
MPHQGHNPNNYGRALLSAPPQAITPNPHTNLLNVYIRLQIKWGFNQKEIWCYNLEYTTQHMGIICEHNQYIHQHCRPCLKQKKQANICILTLWN